MSDDVDRYINRQDSPQKEIIQKLRKIILTAFPDIKEEMKLGVPWYEGLFYLVALKTHVNLGFAIEGLSKEEIKLFEGAGSTMKHVKIFTLEEINEKKIENLLLLVDKASKRE